MGFLCKKEISLTKLGSFLNSQITFKVFFQKKKFNFNLDTPKVEQKHISLQNEIINFKCLVFRIKINRSIIIDQC